jgi:hypothetical protein
MEHVMAALGVGRASAYRRVAHCIDRGLLERLELLRREPSLLRATRRGLRFAGLGLPLAILSPASVDHSLRCASTALLLGREVGFDRVLSERELILAERIEGRPIASAKVGELPDGRPRLHRPDLVVLPAGHPLVRLHNHGGGPVREDDEVSSVAPPRPETVTRPRSGVHARTRERGREAAGSDERALAGAEDMRVICIEVELTPKSSRRLESIIRGWRRAGWVEEVRYCCEPGPTRRAVERAVRKLHAGERIVITEAVPR